MFKRIMVFIFSGLLLLNAYGCVALLAGAVGGAGTAVWLSGKLTQEFHAPYERTIVAAKSALQSLQLEIVKEAREERVTQFKGNYSDGREFWLDVRKVTDNSTKVEVRVGGVSSDKDAASKILKKVQENL